MTLETMFMYRGGELTGTSTHTQYHTKVDECPACRPPIIIDLTSRSIDDMALQELLDIASERAQQASPNRTLKILSKFDEIIWSTNFGLTSQYDAKKPVNQLFTAATEQSRLTATFEGRVDVPIVVILREEMDD